MGSEAPHPWIPSTAVKAPLRWSVNRLLDEFYATRRVRAERVGMTAMIWEPVVDVFETENDVVVRAELPNIDPKNLNIK
ncbi:MAG TPA: hypothetical protein VKZ50_13360 [bacterium]|nr:hypothetical protein [bacterium]